MAEELKLKGEEKVTMALRSLYTSYGYRPYKMGRFEEYDLYAGNKDFLVSGNVITFTDTNGKLMALKPDVTLSIVKSVRDMKGCVSRICYDENVYRVSDRSGLFREIMQAGLECIGDIGLLELCEVAVLAQKSLLEISEDSVLTISHLGIIEGIIKGIKSDQAIEKALEALSSRNAAALANLAATYPESRKELETLARLCTLNASNEEVLASLGEMKLDCSAIDELKTVLSMLDETKVRIDFTSVDGLKYYNGIVLRGYVQGVPVPVLSGGQYDKLMKRMGKKSRAIGFAVYLDALERLLEDRSEFDVDVVLLYKDTDDVAAVLRKAQAFRKDGSFVAVLRSVPETLRCKEVLNA
ncbi:MAG: ATP phosphoribosyltransferase regulatory subunit [Spirochaetales bacterium]|nr:ATP phosphoribosyltransferase regulatory subunit [Spirochaetales bacterium]